MDLDDLLPEEHAILERKRRVLAASKANLLSAHAEIKEAVKAQHALFHRLCPAVRSDRDPNLIAIRISELEVASERLQKDISAQKKILSGEGAEPTYHAEARANLHKLKRELIDTQVEFERNRAFLSPVRLLPVEVLAEIFNLCFESFTDPLGSTISLTSGPLPITHVCSAWRNIAIKKADLWSAIVVTLDNDNDREGWPCLVKLWIERSRNSLLTLAIRVEYDVGDSVHPQSTFFKILDLLTPHARRWKEVEFDNDSSNVGPSSSRKWLRMLSKGTEFSALEAIKIDVDGHMNMKEANRIAKMLCRAPRLRSVYWLVRPSIALPVLPWSRLRRLELAKALALHEVFKLLSDCPLLVKLEITLEVESEGDVLENITHQHLRTLYVTLDGVMRPLFDKLTLPRLQSLSINELWERPTWDHDSFMSFLQRSKCTLRRLSLVDVLPLPNDKLLVMLQKISPSLVSLEVESTTNRCITDDILKALTYPVIQLDGNKPHPVVEILCPKLRELTLIGCVDSTDGVLSLMVDSRLNPTHTTKDPKLPSLRRLKGGTFIVSNHATNVADSERFSKFPISRISYSRYDSGLLY